MSWFGQPGPVLAELRELVWKARSSECSDTSNRFSARRIT